MALCLKSTVALSREAGTVVWRCSLVQRDGKEELRGASKHQALTPPLVSRYLLPRVPQPCAVIPKDRQARAIWPRIRIPWTHIGNPNYATSLPFPPLRFVSAPPLHPCLSVGSSGRAQLSKPSQLPFSAIIPLVMGPGRSPLNSEGNSQYFKR